MTNILLAIDGPLYGKAVVEFVAKHKWGPDTNFKLIHAIEPPRGMEAWPESRLDTEEVNRAKELLEDMSARLKKTWPDAHISSSVCYGYPKEEILAEAVNWPAQVIVMGSHGRSAIQRFLLGSVSLSVVMYAPCSTIVVRLAHEDLAKEELKDRSFKTKATGKSI